jgi:hypothetical protein
MKKARAPLSLSRNRQSNRKNGWTCLGLGAGLVIFRFLALSIVVSINSATMPTFVPKRSRVKLCVNSARCTERQSSWQIEDCGRGRTWYWWLTILMTERERGCCSWRIMSRNNDYISNIGTVVEKSTTSKKFDKTLLCRLGRQIRMLRDTHGSFPLAWCHDGAY